MQNSSKNKSDLTLLFNIWMRRNKWLFSSQNHQCIIQILEVWSLEHKEQLTVYLHKTYRNFFIFNFWIIMNKMVINGGASSLGLARFIWLGSKKIWHREYSAGFSNLSSSKTTRCSVITFMKWCELGLLFLITLRS